MKKIISIDRDGVINKDPGGWTEHSYVTKWKNFIFLPGSIEALKMLNEAGYDIVVISNQAGISKGYYTNEELNAINNKMIKEIERKGAKIKKTYYCIHQDNDNCECRKPKTGLFKQAEKDLDIKASGTYFIGDGKTDIEAGKDQGLTTMLLLSGKTSPEDVKEWSVKPDFIFGNLIEAVAFLLKKG